MLTDAFKTNFELFLLHVPIVPVFSFEMHFVYFTFIERVKSPIFWFTLQRPAAAEVEEG